jgi:uncharacterized membrane protein
MNSQEGSPEREELKRLLERLEALSIMHNTELNLIRSRIVQLESRLSESPKVGLENTHQVTPPPLPVYSPPTDPETPKVSALKQAKLSYPSAPEISETSAPVAMVQEEPVAEKITPTPVKSDESFELDFAKVWFVRIGIVILLTGLVFLGNYAYQNWIKDMSNGVRLTALFLCAGALAEIGRQLAKRENLQRFGEVVLAGGMAFFYYCTFAAHHVTRLKVIDSQTLGAGLLFLSAGAITAVSWIRQAKVTAAFSLVLAAYATMLQPIGWMSCASNLLLASIGLIFMLRPGWSGPGWVSMLGAYAGFLGSQILAYMEFGELSDPQAMLWFLPPLWMMFVIPGLLGRYRENLSERSRAWFAGINNGLFFVIFAYLWIDQNGSADFWKVAAVYSLFLLLIGIVGRRQDTISGGVNISQGLAVGTLAIVLKYDGHQLGLVLAMESLTLAIAAWRFRVRSEVIFSLIAGAISAGLVVTAGDSFSKIPVWSMALSSLAVAAASVVLIRVKTHDVNFHYIVRAAAALLLVAAGCMAHYLCLFRLEDMQGMITAGFIASALAAGCLKLGSKHHQPGLAWVSLWFLVVSVCISLNVDDLGALASVLVMLFPACWLWHRQPTDPKQSGSVDFTHQPALPAWLFSLAIPCFIWQIASGSCAACQVPYLIIQCCAFALSLVAILIRCERLTISSAILSLFTLHLLVYESDRFTTHIFISVLIAFVAAVLVGSSWGRRYISEIASQAACILFRLTGFIAFIIGFYDWSPELWGDWIALSAGLIIVLFGFLERKCPLECLGWIVMSMLWLAYFTTNETWEVVDNVQTWRGGMVVLALVVLTAVGKWRPVSFYQFEDPRALTALFAGLMCSFIAAWASQMLVWRFDWKPAAVLWTILGFIFVSAGLWQRLHIVRVFGFILLVASLAKLFISDVWDFTAFMRVTSFIVLGVALILLGLFYNKFAPTIKALLDSEK